MYSNKNTTSLFLKGRNANTEIDMAKKVYSFEIEKIKGYFGVIGDDLFAGIITAIIILTLTYYGFI